MGALDATAVEADDVGETGAATATRSLSGEKAKRIVDAMRSSVAQRGTAGSTFRPHEAQLRPPQQMRFVFRQERRTRAAWSFPSAQEQAALHA